jgi:hypothetical protein
MRWGKKIISQDERQPSPRRIYKFNFYIKLQKILVEQRRVKKFSSNGRAKHQ